jgi:Fur family ferric uptake transcriptional regulator
MRIVRASLSDAGLLADLHAQCFPDRWSVEAFGELLEGANVIALVAQADRTDVPSGFIFVRVAADEAEVLSIGVKPADRRSGVGWALMLAATEQAGVMGATNLFLEVSVDNASAGALYHVFGFSEVGRRPGYYRNCESVADALILRRALPISAWDFRGDSTSLSSSGCGGLMTRIEKLCAEKGLRMTDQRRVIARVLSDASDHPDAEELYRRAAVIDPHISIATVYRTVRLFEDAGILERHDFRDGRSRYEEVPDAHHDHLIDVQTGKVIEFRNEEIERLQRRVAEELGFELVDHRLELYAVPLKKSGEH